MKIPKIIDKNNRIYVLVQELKNGVVLYKDLEFGYKETFSLFDLGLIQEGVRPHRKIPHK